MRPGTLIRLLAAGALPFSLPGQEPDLSLDIPNWHHSVSVRAAGGYKDNLLLSSANREASASFSSMLDASLYRLPLDGTEVNLTASIQDIRYPQGDQVTDEQSIFAMAQVRRELGQRWSAVLPVVYNYMHQVFDASITETNLTALPVRAHLVEVAPGVRHDLGQRWQAELEFGVQRQLFGSEELDNYWEAGPKLTLSRAYGRKSHVTFVGAVRRRDYDSRYQYTSSGASIPGTSLEYLFTRAEMVWQHHWDQAQRWRTATRVGVEFNRDNGSGYFDYDRFMVSEQLRFRTDSWQFRTQVRAVFYQYALQQADAPETGPRERTTINVGAAVERSLGKNWKLLAEYDYEAALSNLAMDDYCVNTFSGGVEWSF